jgi:multidrug efflux pump subunit AcrA (membrane-fusion protein)
MQHFLRSIVPILILAVGLGAMFALGNRRQESRPDDDGDDMLTVQTSAVLPHTGGLDIQVDGVVTPAREIQVAAEVGGKIIQKNPACRAGNFVAAETVLFVVEQDDYQLELQRARQQLRQVEAELKEVGVEMENVNSLMQFADEELRLNEQDLARMESSGRPDAFSTSEMDQTRKAIVASKNARESLRNQLKTLQAREERLQVAKDLAAITLDKAELDVQRTTVTAPVDGVIVQDLVEEESYVQKGTTLFVIEDTSSVEVRCSLQMEDLYWLWYQEPMVSDGGDARQSAYQVPRTPVTVSYQMAGRSDLEYTWQGVLMRYDGIGVDERTRTIPCRIVVDQPRQVVAVGSRARNLASQAVGPPALVRGMYVTVLVHAAPNATFVEIPETAVQPGKRAWRVRDGRLERIDGLPLVRYVEEQHPEGGRRGYWLVPSVDSGIGAGDRLVTTPMTGMRDGMPVREQPETVAETGIPTETRT